MAVNYVRLKPSRLFPVGLFGEEAVSGKSAHNPGTENRQSETGCVSKTLS